MAVPPRIPVWLRWDQEVIYFVTFNVANRQRVLANALAFAAWQSTVARLTAWETLAGVMMPDHIHVLVAPLHDRDADVGTFSGLMKRWMRQRARHDWQWQKGNFDRLLRSDESAQQKWAYIRENPVRAGLVSRWQDWPYRLGFDDLAEL